ncbi:hypothetical protein N658DRAFT_497911 [Parathielavia hyrcaniae]|uniref:THUMP domain-containing protein n=1 Tax=Parathielavia hyrcaniae TaxID=113614 RepID=A0AAN6T0U9_9PEZI|nr:hypothetical protein N658DRAFT_497911 [Parathielavia hyrcaniae]
MAENGKRKDAPAAAAGQQGAKKKKTGNAGKWTTTHQQAKIVLQKDAGLQPGDTGVWVTCARHQEGKAAREVEVLFAEYAEKMYGIKSIRDGGDAEGQGEEGEDDEDGDLEAAIRREVAALTSKPSNSNSNSGEGGDHNRMTPVKMNVDCLLFVKTRPPVDPVAFVRRICEDARRCGEIAGLMRCRYVNRLTPVSAMGKATEAGLAEVAREVLGGCFDLSGKRSGGVGICAGQGEEGGGAMKAEEVPKTEGTDSGREEEQEDPDKKKPFTFAIRPTIRNHSNLKRDVVINTVAGLINNERHTVNLGAPDKVILVDIYQTVCGMSVVDGDWDELKRFNLTELYSQARNAKKP